MAHTTGNIPGSELILTGTGSIYHLAIGPEYLADTIITVGDPGRVSTVSRLFDRVVHRAKHREFVTHTGCVGKKMITVLSTGIGPDNIDIVFNELDALVNIDFAARRPRPQPVSLTIVRLGTCGGLQDMPVDSIVASTHGIGLDNLLHYYRLTNTDAASSILSSFRRQVALGDAVHPYIAAGDAGLLHQFSNCGFLSGITVTCPGFYAPQGRTLRLQPAFPHLPEQLTAFSHEGRRIMNFEMETAAMYGLAGLLGHRCLSVSAVVANRVTHTFSRNPAKTVKKMIETSLGIIERL